MIDPKSLRIGNTVECVGMEVTIQHFTEHGAHFTNGNGGNWQSLYGIPLSPSLLERAGFKKLNEHYYERDGIGFIVGYAVDGSFVIQNSFGARHCHFYQFHELQNIVRDLTGQELELKP